MSNSKNWSFFNSESDPKGFTLIEVLIALFILVMIGTLTSKALLEAAKIKEVLKQETEFSSEYRTTFQIIERDLAQIFNPKGFLPPNHRRLNPYEPPPPPQPNSTPNPYLLSADQVNQRLRGNAFQSFNFWGPVVDVSGIRPSRFKGKDTEVSFVSASHGRVYREKKESIYAKIKYILENGSLIKYENTRAFELEDPKDSPGLNRYVLLGGVNKLKFQYFKPGEKEPVSEWDSESTDRLDQFPEAISIDLSVKGPEGRIFESKTLIRLEVPNEAIPRSY